LIPWTLDAASGKVTKRALVVDGQPRGYFLFVPTGLTSPAPLLVLFHGSGRDGLSLIEPWKKQAEQEGIVLVGPNARNSAEWATPVDGPKFVIDVVEAVKKAHPINPRRVYLFGHSAGAEFTDDVPPGTGVLCGGFGSRRRVPRGSSALDV
jgi:poly(3-hydroxybutyrate) depolymerase